MPNCLDLLETATLASPVREETNSAVRGSVHPKKSWTSQFPRISCQRFKGYRFCSPARFWNTQDMEMFRERITLRRRERSGMVPQAVSSSPKTWTGTGSRPPSQFLSAYRTNLMNTKDKNRDARKSKVLSWSLVTRK